MPINFAMALDPLIQGPHMQGIVAGTLANIEKVNPNLDYSGGWLPVAIKGGIDSRPGTPSVSDKNLVFALNQYYDEQAPGADRCYSEGGCKVIEVLCDQKYYQVICLETGRPGNTAVDDWTPWQILRIGAPKDFRKMADADAKRLHELRSPPRPINVPNMPANVVLPPNSPANYGNAPGSAYANAPGSAYANAPENVYVNPNNLGPSRRATI